MRPTAIALLSVFNAISIRSALAAEERPRREGVWLEVQRGPGTEQCIDAHALERGVEYRLHRAVFNVKKRAPLRILLALEHRQRAWSAKLELSTDAGERLGQRTIETSAAHCSSLDDSLALVIALLVDGPLAAQVAAAEAQGNPEAPSHAEMPQTAAPPVAVPPPLPGAPTVLQLPASTYAGREPWRLETDAGAALAVGALPGVPFGFELGLAAKPPRAPELHLFGGTYQRREALSGSAGAHFSLLHVGVEVCPLEASWGTTRWLACAGQSIGRLHAAAFGYDQNSSTTRLTFAFLGRGALLIPLAGLVSARLSARAELPLSRDVFVYGARDATDGTVFQMSPVVGVLEAGFLVSL